MIKVGIAGADTPTGGELFRILANHPDIDITEAYAPGHKGMEASGIHHGLIGEREIRLDDSIDLSRLDVLFVCRRDDTVMSLLRSVPEGLKLIDMSEERNDIPLAEGMIYGLSEIYRKAMVRGGTRALVPRNTSSLALVSLYPLATHLLLGNDLRLRFIFPAGEAPDAESLRGTASDVERHLGEAQQSFSHKVEVNGEENPDERRRVLRMKVSLTTSVTLEEILRAYDEVYDDHSFSFIVTGSPDAREVESTHKCIVGLTKPDSQTLEIDAIADIRMRGGAAEGVHLLNLLCGLAERTGLALKANVL